MACIPEIDDLTDLSFHYNSEKEQGKEFFHFSVISVYFYLAHLKAHHVYSCSYI